MKFNKVGALACFGLTVQFVFTLGLIAVTWSSQQISGFGELAEAMADTIRETATAPGMFAFLNLYNASFGITAILTVLAAYELLSEARHRMQLAVIAASIAAALFLAGGVIPIVGAPPLLEANDESALRAMIGVLIGIVLAATCAAGFAVSLGGWSGLSTGRLPKLLCYVLIAGGLVEIFEFAVDPFLALDPALGSIWSVWLGLVFWRSA